MPDVVKVDGKVEFGGKIPNTVNPDQNWGNRFSQSSGFTVIVGDKIKVFVFVDENLWKSESIRRVVTKLPLTIAHVVGRTPDINWNIEAEPIDDGYLGLIVYNDKGKALLAGTYDVESSTAQLNTLYPGITNKCKQKLVVKVSHETEGGTKIEGEASIEYEQ